MFYTTDNELKKTQDYKDVVEVLALMNKSGGIGLADGNCISASEMVRQALLTKGIKSHLVEVTLTLKVETPEQNNVQHVGFNGISKPGYIDTHMIVVTDTVSPMIIDASISNRLPEQYIAVVDIANSGEFLNETKLFDPARRTKVSVIYKEKSRKLGSHAYQESIIDRMVTDAKIFKEISYLKTLNYIGIAASCFSIVNSILNLIMLGYFK